MIMRFHFLVMGKWGGYLVKTAGFWFVLRFSSLSQKVIHPITIVSQTDVLSSYANLFYEGDNTSQHFVVQSLTHVSLFVTPWMAARQVSLPFPVSQSLLKIMSIVLVMLSRNFILCHLLLLLLSNFPCVSIFSNESVFSTSHQVAKVFELQV